MGKERPPQVEDARRRDDREALSAMGKKGAEVAAMHRDVDTVVRADKLAERVEELAKTETVTPEGDVLPPKETK